MRCIHPVTHRNHPGNRPRIPQRRQRLVQFLECAVIRGGLKHRLNLEHVSGLSQQAVVHDVAAKIMCDNLQTLATLTARDQADLRVVDRVNHAYPHTALKS